MKNRDVIDDRSIRDTFERALTDESMGATFLHRFMELKITPDPRETTVEFAYRTHFANRQGRLHGGIIAFLVDTAMGNLHRAVHGVPGMTLELKIQYLSGATGGTLTCRARPTKAGRRVSFFAADLVSEDDNLIATATATWVRAE